MKVNTTAILLIIGSLFLSCSKQAIKPDEKPKLVILKLELLQGNGQTDTIGKTLVHPIIVRVDQDSIPAKGYSVQFVTSGCGQTDTISTLSQPDGTAVFNWPLTGGVGQQTLKAYVLNSLNNKVDSVTVWIYR